MVAREEVLWRLAKCLSLQSSTSIHLNHQREALSRYGLGEQAQADLADGVRRLMEATREHTDSLGRLRERILRGERDV
jgi:hypothetical protein